MDIVFVNYNTLIGSRTIGQRGFGESVSSLAKTFPTQDVRVVLAKNVIIWVLNRQNRESGNENDVVMHSDIWSWCKQRNIDVTGLVSFYRVSHSLRIQGIAREESLQLLLSCLKAVLPCEDFNNLEFFNFQIQREGEGKPFVEGSAPDALRQLSQ